MRAIECGAKRCPHCHYVERDDKDRIVRVSDKVRPLSTEDLQWWFCEAESRLGVRSTFGAFVDLAMSGIQGGGRSNGPERAWTDRKLDAAGRERCIRTRLAPACATHPQLAAVLAAAYGPHALAERAERVTGDRDARVDLAETFGPVLPLALLTDAAASLFKPAPPASEPPSELRGRVTVGAPGALLVLESVLRRDGAVETVDAVETDVSYQARVQAGETAVERHEVHLRRWRAPQDAGGVLARLAALVRAAKRAMARPLAAATSAEHADDRARHQVDRMRSEAKELLRRADEEAGIAAPRAPDPAPRRRSVQRSRKVRVARAG